MTKEELEHNYIKEIADKYVHESWGTYLDLDEVDLVLAGIGVAKIISKEKDERIKELEVQIEKLEKENVELKEQNRNYEQLIETGSVTLVKEKLKNYKHLTEAKEIIQTLIDSLEVSEGEEIKESKVIKEAEQFLKEK